MNNESIVLMLKNKSSGYLDKELAIIKIEENIEMITAAYVTEEDDGYYVHMMLTCGVDVSDTDFERIFDEYGDECEFDGVDRIFEVEDCYNPTWELIFGYEENHAMLSEKIIRIIEMHKSELQRILLID